MDPIILNKKINWDVFKAKEVEHPNDMLNALRVAIYGKQAPLIFSKSEWLSFNRSRRKIYLQEP